MAKIKWFTTPVYEASGKLICARTEESINEGATVTSAELGTPSSLAETYSQLIKSDLVVNKVIQNLNLNMTTDQLRGSVELTPLTRVYYIISVRSTDREKTAEIANEFMKVFSEEIKQFYEIDNIYIVDRALTPSGAINMNITKNVKIFAGIGLVIAVGMVMIMFIFNNTVTSAEQIKRYTKLTTLASIPKYNGKEEIIAQNDPKSPYVESIKILRTNLKYMYNKGDLKTVAIMSSLPSEGKSWLTANLAVTFANTGKKTLIIDADMRRGRQHQLFKIDKVLGLSEYLELNKESIEKIKETEEVEKVNVNTEMLDDEVIAEIQRLSGGKLDDSIIAEIQKARLQNEEMNKEQTMVTNNNEMLNSSNDLEDDDCDILEFVKETNIENLYVIPSGSPKLESSELLSTNKFEKGLEKLKEEFDVIVVDAPPVSVVADGFIISRIVDTNIIVLKHGNTEINELNKIKNNINEIGGNVIGTVINKIPDANKKYYNTYYNK